MANRFVALESTSADGLAIQLNALQEMDGVVDIDSLGTFYNHDAGVYRVLIHLRTLWVDSTLDQKVNVARYATGG